MINDWQNMSAYRPRKKIQRQKTTQKKKKKKQRKCTSTSPHTISESQKRESSSSSKKKKLLWLWIRWKMQFCFGRCGSTVIHQKGTFVGKSSSLLSLTLFPKHKIWKLSEKTKNTCFFAQIENGQTCSVREVACLIIWLSWHLILCNLDLYYDSAIKWDFFAWFLTTVLNLCPPFFTLLCRERHVFGSHIHSFSNAVLARKKSHFGMGNTLLKHHGITML